MVSEPTRTIEIFICYARKDEALRAELEKHLCVLKRQELITIWRDRDISAGADWEREIDKHLNTAQIILLLVSPDFMASDYCYGMEMKRALERHERGEARAIPVILRPVSWQETPIAKLQAVPRDAKPIKSWSDLDEAFLDVAKGIRGVVDELINSIAEEERNRRMQEEQARQRAEQLSRQKEKELALRKIKREEMIVEQQHLPLAVGVDLDGTQLRVAVLRGSTQLSLKHEPTGDDLSPDCIISRIHSAIQWVLYQAGTKPDQVAGIGISVAGPLDSYAGVVFSLPNLPKWNNVPLRTIFERHYALPVFIENKANAAALGELMFGAGRGCKDMIYLTIGTDIGGSVIVNGQLIEGRTGTAGELGHLTVDWHGERCNCGNFGCLESIASGRAIAHRARLAMAHGVDFFDRNDADLVGHTIDNPEQLFDIDAEVVVRTAMQGSPAAFKIIRDAAEALGVGLVTLIHIFNPDMIVLGGELIQKGSLLMEPALQVVNSQAMVLPSKAVKIVQTLLGVDAGLVGAGALIYTYTGKGEEGILQS